MLVHIKKLINHTKRNNYCLGAFNIHNIESIKGVLIAADKNLSPAIIQVSPSSVEYIGAENIVCMVGSYAKELAPKIPIALHLDHGKDLNIIKKCIKAGFSSVHIDGSSLEIDKNIALTKKAVEFAHNNNVYVQGEVGEIKGGHGVLKKYIFNVPLVDIKNLQKFIKETKVDTISAALGTAHGNFSNQKISYKLISQIREFTKKPLVLHGGSGVQSAKIKKAVKMGVNIVNIGTDVKIAFSGSVREQVIKNKKEHDPRVIMSPSINEVAKVVSKKMKLFGSINNAKK